VMFVFPKTIRSLNNTAAGANGRFSTEAEIKTKFFVSLSVLNYTNISLADSLSVVFCLYY
jgi:hypothetical protein